MKKRGIRTARRSLFLSLTAMTFLAFGQSSARGDEVTISGSTTGTVTGIPRLTFTGNPNFTGTTTLGVGSLIGLNNNLGTFILSIAGLGQAQSVAGSFTLNVTFTGPAGIAGGQGRSFNANLTGTISPFSGFEGVLIDFNNTPVLFTFNDGVNSGSFTLALNDILIPSGDAGVQITARITGSQTVIPEPATLFLLGTGLIGVAAASRAKISWEDRHTQ
jgi:PEP-CTERM motif